MKKQLAQLLEMAELKPEEVTIYLHLLKLKSATIPQLVTLTGLNTMMIYRTLKRLANRELVKAHPLNNKQNTYSPLSLCAIINRVTQQRQKLDRLERAFRGLDNLLPLMDVSSDDDVIEIHEGVEAMLEEYLKIPDLCKTEFLHIGAGTKTWDLLGLDFDCAEERNFIKRRMNRGVHARVLNEPAKEMERITLSDTLEKRTTRVKEKLPIMHNYLVITDNQSHLFVNDTEHPRVITMRQPDILTLQKQQFYDLWTQG